MLSQWRSYGSYAIEFDEKILGSEVSSLRECIYKQKAKRETAKLLVTHALADISQEMANNECRGCLASLDALINIMEFAAIFKDEGFYEEQEMRIVAKETEGDDSIKFRQKNNKLIPYVEKEISLDCIKAIHVGPMNDQKLAFTSMAAFVRNIEKNWQVDTANIENELTVIKSPIPYRGNG